MLLATAESPVCRLGSFHSQTFLLVFSGGDGQATLQMSPRVLTDTFQATREPAKGIKVYSSVVPLLLGTTVGACLSSGAKAGLRSSV